jgi:hypothetical protein
MLNHKPRMGQGFAVAAYVHQHGFVGYHLKMRMKGLWYWIEYELRLPAKVRMHWSQLNGSASGFQRGMLNNATSGWPGLCACYCLGDIPDVS